MIPRNQHIIINHNVPLYQERASKDIDPIERAANKRRVEVRRALEERQEIKRMEEGL